MSDRSAAIGLASVSDGWPPPNSSAWGCATNDQLTASTRPRAASARLARRVRSWNLGQDRLARRVAAIERRKWHPVDADDPHDFLDDVGLAFHVGAPRRHGDLDDRSAAGDGEAEMAEDAAHLDQRHLDAGQPLHLVEREVDDAVVAMRLADDDGFGWLAAAQLASPAASRARAPAP